MRDGSLRVYSVSANLKEIKLIFMSQVSKEWIEDLKFSPDGKKLAVGSHDNFIYVFNAENLQTKPKKFGKSSSYITHIDWSLDSNSLRTNDGSYEVLYYNVETGKQDTNGVNSFRDEPWASNTCTFSWGSIGIWQSG